MISQGQQLDIDIYSEALDKMTYTEQANKRTNCKRLTWYHISPLSHWLTSPTHTKQKH